MASVDYTLLWLETWLATALFYWMSVGYASLVVGRLSPAVLSESLAFTGGVLIGCSFLLSSLSYFYNLFDPLLRYRKYAGLTGYYLALAYAGTLVLRFPERYGWGLSQTILESEVILGLIAMAIFTLMALISGNWAVKRLGKYWRQFLRTGYIAYGVLIIRAVLIEGDLWWAWIRSLSGLPTPRLLLSLFALMVIGFRLALSFSLWRQRRHSTLPSAAIPENGKL